MKKIRTIVAVVMSTVLVLSLTACGAQAVTSEPAPQPAVEASAEVEVTEPAPEPIKEPEVEEPSEEPIVEEPSEEPEDEAPSEEPEEPEEPEEVDPMEALMESNMGEYISDGAFDADKFSKDTGASFWWLGSYSLLIGYGDDMFIQIGNGDKHPELGYIAIGNWDETNSERGNLCTYSFLFPSGNDITITGDVNEISVPVNCMIYLEDVASSIKENGVDIAPDVPGTDFRPCDPMDESIQY